MLEGRYALTVPAAPVIIEPLTNGQVVSKFDVHMEIDSAAFFDADGHLHSATSWQIRQSAADGGQPVWQALGVTDPLSKIHLHLGDGAFVGSLAGATALLPNRDYVLTAEFTDSNGEVSTTSQRSFRTASDTTPVPGVGDWLPREGYVVETVASPDVFRLAVNIAFVPNPGPNPTDPYLYVAELYGSIKVVSRSGVVSEYASGLLDYNPDGPFSGTGEQGFVGMAVDPVSGDLFVSMMWNNGTTDAQRGGTTLHYPKVERLQSTDGGRTMATRSIVLNMQPETQGQSHQISNVTIGPDSKLYVHMGDGFQTAQALNLNSYLGKVLRMNLDGTAPVDNPLYNAADGISARDYIFTYGHRNAFGGAWRAADGKHYVVENGNGIDRLVQLDAGQSYGWAGSDTTINTLSNYVWSPATAPVNIAFVQPETFGGSLFPLSSQGDAFVTLTGPTYSLGPQARGKRIEWFPDVDSRDANGKFTTPPITVVQYNGTGRGTIAGLAAGADGLYFTDLYRDDGVGGPTAIGASVYRLRYVDFEPTNVTGVAGDSEVTLTWNSNALATSHNVYRTIEDGTFELLAANVAGSSYIDTTAVNGEHYHYIVRGVNAGGESSESNEAHGEPQAGLGNPPTVVTPAGATPTEVVGTTTNLSVLGDDDGGEANVTYTWSIIGTAPAPVAYSENGTNAAKNTTATFSGAGTYLFAVTLRDADGQTETSTVSVTVNQTFTSVAISPASATVFTDSTRQFTATGLDQFGTALATQPAFTWDVMAGGVGTINASGLYTAGSATGTATVRATSDAFVATAAVAVSQAVQGQGLLATYFDNQNFTGRSIIRTDATVNFDFGSGSPNGFIQANTFSARWLGAIAPRYSDNYTFIATADDGVRLWINNVLVIDRWQTGGATAYTGNIQLVAGQLYPIRMEYFENTGLATVKLEWQSASQAREVVPQSRLFRSSPIRVNFGPANAPVPPVYMADNGRAFATRDNGYVYGWNGNNTSTTRDRNSANAPDQRYDTFAHMQKSPLTNGLWEIVVPNGTYRVHAVAGDPTAFDSRFRINVENVLAINANPTSSQRFAEAWLDVMVLDGRLTVSNGTGAQNNKINFIDIIPLGLDYSAGFAGAASSITRNGSAAIVGPTLQLTNGAELQAGSAFSTRTNVSKFATQFDFRMTPHGGDGITFAIQAAAATAIGDIGGGLGYGFDPNNPIRNIPNSIAVKFDLFDNNGEGYNSTGLYINGAAPGLGGVEPFQGLRDLNSTGIDLHSSHTFRTNITYDGSQLAVSITDLETRITASQFYSLDLLTVLGSSTAFVGFTGGTGGVTMTSEILNWGYFPL